VSRFLRVLQADILKLRRSLALRLAILAPLMVILLEALIALQRGKNAFTQDQNAWIGLMQHAVVFWSLLMLPLFITLVSGLSANLEHTHGGWKLLFVQPVPRWILLTAKQLEGLILLGISFACLFFITMLTGLTLQFLRPDIGFSGPIPWERFLLFILGGFLSSWLMLSIQQWISFRWSSFVGAMAFGVFMTVAGMFVINSKWGPYYPWTLPGVFSMGFNTNIKTWASVVTGLIGGVVVSSMSVLDISRKDVLQ
jgi:hypothetical protein